MPHLLPHGNLPGTVSTFVGREQECAEVAHLLRTTRLLTLVGTGGAGKTRLAQHVAATLADEYADGVWFVELAPLADPALVAQAAARSLGVREQAGRSVVAALEETLARYQALLVLDNCEHVIDASARLADAVLRAGPGLRILATSREPLNVAGEVIWRVPPLGLTGGDGDDGCGDAVRLFLDRARASAAAFALDEANHDAVVEICQRLDGLPLAIELAAARVRLLSPREIADRLDDRFRLLVGGSRTAPPRQQTLAAAVDWSYDQLSEPEQRLFQRASVFADGFSLSALEAIAEPDERPDVLDLVSRLVDRSLIVVDTTGAETRYRLLETLRAYAHRRLVASGEEGAVQRRLVDWMLDQSQRADAAYHGPEQGRWLRWAEHEHGNLRVVLRWLAAERETDDLLRLVAALWWPWTQRGHWQEAQHWFQQCLTLPGASARTATRARLLAAAGAIAVIGGGDAAEARRRLEEAIAIGLEVDDPVTIFNARGLLNGVLAIRDGSDLGQVEARAFELLDYVRTAGIAWGENRALVTLAEVAFKRGDLEAGEARLNEAASVARSAQDGWSLAMTVGTLGDVERARGQHTKAGLLYEQSLALFADIGLADHPIERPYLLHNLGYVALAAGQTDLAWERFAGAVFGNRRAGDRRGMAECLIGFGATAAADGDAERAAQLFAAGEAALAAVRAQVWHSNRRDYDRWREVARQQIGQAAFDRAWTVGATCSVDDAIELAERRPAKRAVAPSAAGGLTPREHEVARLAASGLSNRQIGQMLVITEKTAANHVQRVLDKLGVHSRTQLAARASELGLDATG
jgi:predicted ATPase/DNA-binding CsgD family transcriptional regulator